MAVDTGFKFGEHNAYTESYPQVRNDVAGGGVNTKSRGYFLNLRIPVNISRMAKAIRLKFSM